MAFQAILCTLVILVAGSTGLMIRNEERVGDVHEASLVVTVVSQNPFELECTIESSGSDILQYGVSYSKSFALMAKGQLLAAEYDGESVKCCIVEISKLAEKSLTPCGDVFTVPSTPAPTTPEPTTPEPTTPEPTTPEPTTPEPTTPEPTTPAPTTTTTPPPTTTTPALTTTTPAPYYSCPSGFTKNGHYCFFFSTDKKEWSPAVSACKKKNSAATLARPVTKAIDDFIHNKIKSTGQSYWFDLSDKNKEGTFKYSNGQSPAYKRWEGGEPDNGPWYSWNDEDCVVYDEDDDHKWNDQECHNDYRYVCQMFAIFNQG